MSEKNDLIPLVDGCERNADATKPMAFVSLVDANIALAIIGHQINDRFIKQLHEEIVVEGLQSGR